MGVKKNKNEKKVNSISLTLYRFHQFLEVPCSPKNQSTKEEYMYFFFFFFTISLLILDCFYPYSALSLICWHDRVTQTFSTEDQSFQVLYPCWVIVVTNFNVWLSLSLKASQNDLVNSLILDIFFFCPHLCSNNPGSLLENSDKACWN